MKYIDPITKEKKTIYTKASDTLPLGAIVDFDGEEIPAGWEPAPEDATVYIGPNEPTDGQDIWIQKGKNLFNGSLELGTINENGIFKDGGASVRSIGFIPVTPNANYVLSNDKAYNIIVYGYDSLGQGRHLFRGLGTLVFNVPEDIKYITFRTSTQTTENDLSVKFQLELGSVATEFEPYIDKKVYLKNEAGSYDLFVKNRVHVGPYQPEDGEEVWIQKSRNLFNINGNVNISGAGGGQTGYNIVSGNILTSNVNTAYEHNVGQKFMDLKGKTFTVSAKVLSVGTGSDGYTAIYDNNVLKKGLSVKAGETVTLTYTGTSDNIVVGFATASGEGAQFTNIQVELGNVASDYEPYLFSKKVYTKNDNGGYDEFYNGEENIYSLEEKRIGTWTNGKPLYRKMIPCGFLETGGQTVEHGVQNIDVIASAKGFFHNTATGTWFPIPRAYPTDMEKYGVAVDVGKQTIYLTSGTNFDGKTFYAWITMEYTKTTD